MTSKEAIKRLRQETAPATYMQDFDKEECLQVIEKELRTFDAIIDYLDRRIAVAVLDDEKKAFKEIRTYIDLLKGLFDDDTGTIKKD